MKLMHLSDVHIEDGPRLDECAKVLDTFIDHAQRERVDLILDAGDKYHPHVSGRPATITEELFAAEYLRRMAEIAPVVGIAGNHEAKGDIEIFNRLEAENPIWFASVPHTYSFREWDVICLPWFSKTHLTAQLPAELSPDEVSRRTNQVAQQLLIAMRARAQQSRGEGRIPIGLGHLMVAGSTLSSGQDQSVMGVTVALTPWDLNEVGAAVFCLGHVHAAQSFMDGAVAYAGSPMRHDFGEKEDKGFRLIEIEKDGDGYKVRNDFVELPARRIELYELDFTDEENLSRLKEHGIAACVGLTATGNLNDAMVRFRYHIRLEDQHRAPKDEIEKLLYAGGAFTAKAEPIVAHQVRVRSEAIVKADTDWEKLQAVWQSKGIEIPDDVVERLRASLALLQSGKAPGEESPIDLAPPSEPFPSDELFPASAEARA